MRDSVVGCIYGVGVCMVWSGGPCKAILWDVSDVLGRAFTRLLKLSVRGTSNKEIFWYQPSINQYSLPPTLPPSLLNNTGSDLV